MKFSWPQYVTDYCTLIKSNKVIQSILGKLFTCLLILYFEYIILVNQSIKIIFLNTL